MQFSDDGGKIEEGTSPWLDVESVFLFYASESVVLASIF